MFKIYLAINTNKNSINTAHNQQEDYDEIKNYDNALFYFVASSWCLLNKKYLETLHFATIYKERLLEDVNYKRIIYLNYVVMNCYIHFKNYEGCADLSYSQLLTLKSFGITTGEYEQALKLYLTCCVALEKYNSIISIIESKKDINLTQLCTYLIALYNEDKNKYFSVIKEATNDGILSERHKKFYEILDCYLTRKNKNCLNDLNQLVMPTLIDVLKEKVK